MREAENVGISIAPDNTVTYDTVACESVMTGLRPSKEVGVAAQLHNTLSECDVCGHRPGGGGELRDARRGQATVPPIDCPIAGLSVALRLYQASGSNKNIAV